MGVIVAPETRDLDTLAGQLAAWLTPRIDGAQDVRVENLAYPHGAGRSHETILFDVSWTAAGERAIVDACLAGEPGAIDAIVERHRRQVYQLCFRYVGNHEDAADLAQDTFIRAFKGLRGFKAQSTLSAWLYRIAVNVCLNRVALKTPRADAFEPAERIDTSAERPDVALLRAERATEVRAAIRTIDRLDVVHARSTVVRIEESLS